MKVPKKVLVNILTYNSQKYISGCIESVEKQTYPHVELMVTDNCSQDGSFNKVARLFPHVSLQRNEENMGFARAHNAAIDSRECDYYLPLNPDVVLDAHFVEEMVGALEKDPTVGSGNGRIFFLSSEGKKTDHLYATGQEFDKARRSSPRGYKEKDSPLYDKPAYVFGANGATPLYKREFLEAVKIKGSYFDRDFFLYSEDVDIGWRGILMGYRCLYVPRAVAYHYSFGSEGLRQRFIQYQYERNRFLAIYKNDLIKFFLPDLPYFLFHESFNLIFYLFQSPGRIIQYGKALIDFVRMIPAKRPERLEIMARMVVDKGELRDYYRNPLFRKLIMRWLHFRPTESSREVD